MSTAPNIPTACTQAREAFESLAKLSPDFRATILDAIATALDARRAEILSTTADETALTIEELTPEFVRMTGTLRMFATLIREGSWVRASIDTKVPNSGLTPALAPTPALPPPSSSLIGPNHDLRKLLIPLGPIAIFGSSNFPLAYGVCGGDTASALAAGCPVIVKEHPAHPRTGRLLAHIAQQAISSVYEPSAQAEAASRHILQYIHNEDPKDFTIAQQLVQHRNIAAIGFTGSTVGGMALQSLSQKRRYPIPVYAEMGSLNTVFVSFNSYAKRGQSIADEIAASVLARVGQQCTKPGAVFIAGNNEHWGLHRMICARLLAVPPRRMLSRSVADNYYRGLDIITQSSGILETTPLPTPAQRDAMLGVPVVIAASDVAMEDAPEVWEEIFGPAVIIARHNDSAEYQLDGRLGVSVYGEPDDFTDAVEDEEPPKSRAWGDFSRWFRHVKHSAGRIIFNGPPTGVRVATSTVHGGPFPATNAPHTTAVGPLAIERWCRPICFQNCPDNLLPPELQNANPRGLWRTINGELTRSPVS